MFKKKPSNRRIKRYRRVANWRYWIPRKEFLKRRKFEKDSLKVFRLPVFSLEEGKIQLSLIESLNQNKTKKRANAL